MTKRVLVTGGAGQLGQAMRLHMDARFQLTQLDTDPCQASIWQADVTDPDAMREAVKGYDAVVHAAALHGRHVRSYSTQEFLRTNVEGTGNVIEACAVGGVGHVVLMSSTSVYGLSVSRSNLRRTVLVDENTPRSPHDINDLCKILAEETASYLAQRHGLPLTVLRCGRFFVGDPIEFNLAKLAGAVDVADVVQAIALSLLTPPEATETYCVASSTRFKGGDIPRLSNGAADVIEARYPGTRSALSRLGRALPTRVHRVVNIRKARDRLGYQPTENFDMFIERLAKGSSEQAGR